MIKIYQHETGLQPVESFIKLPEISRYRVEDSYDEQAYFPPKGLWIDYHGLGMLNFLKESSCSLSIHGYILRKHYRYYRDMMAFGVKWFNANTPPHIIKLTAKVPECYPQTIEICASGMTLEGITRMDYRKRGRIYNSRIFGVIKLKARSRSPIQ